MKKHLPSSLSKSLRKLSLSALALGVSLSLFSCAGQLPNADGLETDSAFGLLADNDGAGHARHFGHKGMGGPMMGMFMKDLNLSAEQKAQFKALFEQAKAQHQDQGNREKFKTVRETIKTAFLSEHFDAAALRAQLQQNLPAAGRMIPEMASNLVKAWQILTPEQQNKVVTRLEQMAAKMQEFQQKAAQQPPKGDHLQKLAEQLQITPEQKARLQALWQSGQGTRTERMQNIKAVKDQVLAELKSGNPSADKIAALITPLAQNAHQGMGGQLDKLAALHDILTPAQRQQLVSIMEQKMQQHRGRFGRHKRQG